MLRIAYLILPVVLALPASAVAQPLSPHEKISEIYKIIRLCPALKVDRKALDRFAMLAGVNLTPGSLEDKWFLRRADYELRRISHLRNGYICRQGIVKYGPEGELAKGLMLTN
jgi:hypothetical protein